MITVRPFSADSISARKPGLVAGVADRLKQATGLRRMEGTVENEKGGSGMFFSHDGDPVRG
jgi:hypothetical protein